MSQIATRSDAIANQLLELFHLRKSLLGSARPEKIGADSNLEDTASSRLERDLAYFILKCCQQLLRGPRGAEKPTALRAVFDFDLGQAILHLG